eukprot:210146-Amphidinium_carterae.1
MPINNSNLDPMETEDLPPPLPNPKVSRKKPNTGSLAPEGTEKAVICVFVLGGPWGAFKGWG